MTARGDFTPDEWQVVLEGPPSAGMIVVTAQRGGTFRETIAMAKAYVEARKQHGESELLDEIVSAKPEIDHTRYRSVEELEENGLKHLRDAVALLQRKATPECSSSSHRQRTEDPLHRGVVRMGLVESRRSAEDLCRRVMEAIRQIDRTERRGDLVHLSDPPPALAACGVGSAKRLLLQAG